MGHSYDWLRCCWCTNSFRTKVGLLHLRYDLLLPHCWCSSPIHQGLHLRKGCTGCLLPSCLLDHCPLDFVSSSLVAEGARLVSPSLEAFLYMVMDVSAKCVFGFIIVQARPALEAIQSSETD